MNKYLLLSLIALSACSTAESGSTNHFWLDAGVINKIQNPAEALYLPKPPLEFWVWVTDETLDSTNRAYTPVWFVFNKSNHLWIVAQ